MVNLPQIVNRIGHWGLTDDLPPDRFRCLFATNLACFFHLFTTLPYVFLFAFYRSWMLSGMALGLCLAYPAAIYLMKRRKYSEARFLMLASITGAIFVFCLFLGESSRLETTLLYTVAAPAIFFSVREAKLMSLAIVMPVFAYTLLHSGGYDWLIPYPLTPGQIDFFNVSITATTALLILLPVVLLLRTQVDTEQALIAARDKAEKSSKAKSEFLATVSHELRTPLNGLLGTLELIQDGPLSKDQVENLGIARTSGNLLKTVIADILDFSRFEKGLVSLEAKPTALPELIRHCIAGFKSFADEKHLHLGFQVRGEFPSLLGDASRLQQIATNLIGNALKFTDKGSVTVRLISEQAQDHSLALVIEVEDTGIGIPPDKLSTLFEPFTQAHRGSRIDHGGCGLGLSICHRLAQLMQGTLTVQSEEGKGSLFRFAATLPITPQSALVHSSQTQGPVASAPADDQGRMAGRVLLVEDVAVNRIVAAKFLARLGLQVDAVENGRQAVDAYVRQNYDWILMDCQMPVMNGFEATREIRRLASTGEGPASPVIIALTANAQPEDRIKCFEAGMDAFLEKPISSEALQTTLKRLFIPAPDPG
jgi:signal transduction histidine kinase/CheY-like chemotaxis protein